MALDGKVAIVTGASRGIGEYIARALAGAGVAVVVAARTTEVTDKRLPGTIYTVADHIKQRGGRALPVRLDVRDPESITSCVQQTVAEFGRLDIVVNNAAILVPGTLDSVQARHLDLIWQIDLRGPLLLMKEALPHLRAAGEGHIINVSSRAASSPGPARTSRPGLAARSTGWSRRASSAIRRASRWNCRTPTSRSTSCLPRADQDARQCLGGE